MWLCFIHKAVAQAQGGAFLGIGGAALRRWLEWWFRGFKGLRLQWPWLGDACL